MSGDALTLARTILVLDDFPDSAEALCEWLRLEGWDAQAANSTEEAIGKVEAASPAVVLMEPWLRAGSAMSVATTVRQRSGDATLLIALTAWGRAGDQVAFGPSLFDVILRKPLDGHELREILDRRPRS